jgi:hypothetical protein
VQLLQVQGAAGTEGRKCSCGRCRVPTARRRRYSWRWLGANGAGVPFSTGSPEQGSGCRRNKVPLARATFANCCRQLANAARATLLVAAFKWPVARCRHLQGTSGTLRVDVWAVVLVDGGAKESVRVKRGTKAGEVMATGGERQVCSWLQGD